jgi:hypothetical protein
MSRTYYGSQMNRLDATLLRRKYSKYIERFLKADKQNVKNYRGVVQLSATPKFLDMLVNEKITSHVHETIDIQQHGFKTGRSTETNILEFNHQTKLNMKKGSQTDVVYIDFEKAFDQVPFAVISSLLPSYGINGNLQTWLMSYLTNRSQSVKIKEAISSSISVTLRVIQGSHSGPTLFKMFINTLPKFIDMVCYLGFADNFKFYKEIKDIEDCHLLQAAVIGVDIWSHLYGLKVKISKCTVMTQSRNYHSFIHHASRTYHES